MGISKGELEKAAVRMRKWMHAEDRSIASEKFRGKVKHVSMDIITIQVDAIVNAANEGLFAGAGVCGSIFKAADKGGALSRACRKIGHCDTGSAIVTSGFGLKNSKYIIHAVGPIDGDPDLLQRTYESVLKLVDGVDIRSIAFPPIATGVYRFPKIQAAEIVLKLVFSWLNTSSNANRVDQIILTTFLDDSGVYETLFPVVFGSQEGSTAAAL